MIGAATQPQGVRHRGLLMTAIMAATVMQYLDATIANVALPHMQSSLNASIESISWVLTSFMLASALTIPITGWLTARFGTRNVFLVSVTGFIVASMLCGAATSLTQMVCFRVFQGVCAALIAPLSQAILLDSTPQSGHTRVMSLWGMATMIGPIAGPMLGGFLTENLNWRWVFYINVPIGIPTIAILWWLLPAPASTPRKLDMFGFIVLALGLAAIQLALDRGHHEDWLESWEIILELAIGAAAIWIFVIHSLTARNPLFETVLFKNRTFVLTLFFMVVMGFLMFGVSSLLPSLLQSVFGFPVIDSGILSAPRGAGIMLCMYLMPQLIARFPRKWIIATGYAIAAVSIHMMTLWSLETDATAIVLSGVVQGLGMGLTFIPLNTLAFENLPPHLRTDGASLLNLMRTFGGSIGISFFATSIARSIQYNHEELGGRITETTIPAFNPDLLREFGAYGDAMFKMIDLEVLRQSTMLAYLNSFEMLFYLILMAPILAAFLQSDAKKTAPKGPLEAPH